MVWVTVANTDSNGGFLDRAVSKAGFPCSRVIAIEDNYVSALQLYQLIERLFK